MQIMKLSNNRTNQKQSFGMGVSIKTAGMTSLEREVISHNLERINSAAKDVEMKINLVNKGFSRYFNVEVSELKMPNQAASNDIFIANPTSVFNMGSPSPNLEKTLFNNIERAKNAFYHQISPPTINI